MARRSGRSSSSYYAYAERDDFFSPSLVRGLLPRVYLRPVPSAVVLSPLEDRRFFHPLGAAAPAASVSRRSQRSLRPGPKSVLRFSVPEKVIVCIRRRRRREVLHALNKTQSGAGRSRRTNFYSSISCKR